MQSTYSLVAIQWVRDQSSEDECPNGEVSRKRVKCEKKTGNILVVEGHNDAWKQWCLRIKVLKVNTYCKQEQVADYKKI